jgi:hypothetical protein
MQTPEKGHRSGDSVAYSWFIASPEPHLRGQLAKPKGRKRRIDPRQNAARQKGRRTKGGLESKGEDASS